ncbi:MAG: YihA family ribosome biogenesis GTP-binding protein [bacterium]|nr:YihA family ribosome biogenesis GTP-binding protein [bacterium]
MSQLPKDSRPQVALAGRSNVGKSTLLNRLVGHRNLAKVSSTPGKTRSLNFFSVSDRFYLVDLPGYGYAKVSKSLKDEWGKLIETYLRTSPNLTGLVILLDVRRDVTDDDLQMLEWLAKRSLPVLAVVTKTDKVSRNLCNKKVADVERQLEIPAIPFSSITGIGKDELIGSILDLISTTTTAKG